MKQRVLNIFIFLFIIIIYTIVVLSTDFAIPCFFKKITDFKCPGCGITGMYINMLHFDLKNAFLSNPIIFCAQPLIYFEIGKSLYCYVFDKKNKSIFFENCLIIILLVILILYGILRNVLFC